MHAHRGTDRAGTYERSRTPESEAPQARQRILELQRAAGNAAVTRILQGPDSSVQRNGTGLAGKKPAKKYANTVKKVHGGWAHLAHQERLSALIEPANNALRKLEVPQVIPIIDPLGGMRGTAERASFVRVLWQVWFNPDCLADNLDDQTFGRVANTVYHECRHAEQTFRVARKLATDGDDAHAIAHKISIDVNIAAQAVAKPLSRKKESEWAEAKAWQFNMEVVDGTSSRADLVNVQKDIDMMEYNKARAVWRGFERVMNRDPAADPDVLRIYDAALLKSGGAARMKEVTDGAKEKYIITRERAKQAYLQYVKMPLEEDAWSTGGLIERHLGLKPTEAKDELANLDADERSMTPVLLLAISSGSAQEKNLLSAIKDAL